MRVLFVCSGNICRSPMAEGILRHLLSRAAGSHEVASAGTLDIEGRPPSLHAQLACLERGVDIEPLASKALTPEQLAWADVVLCMERGHVEECRRRARAPLRRVELLGALDDALWHGEVPDPVGQDLDAFRIARDMIWELAERFLAKEGLLPYAPYFCEENVWHLLDDERLLHSERWAVVLSNPGRSCALWSQRAAAVPGTCVVWDYHVVVVARASGGGFEVWDLDCTEGWPLPAERWLDAALGPAPDLPDELVPRFRVIARDEYRARFCSDRAHMRGSDGELIHEAPPWPPILVENEPSNLERFIDVERAFVGEVLDLQSFARRFAAG